MAQNSKSANSYIVKLSACHPSASDTQFFSLVSPVFIKGVSGSVQMLGAVCFLAVF